MMGRLNHDQGQFFYSFRLDEAVPDDHPIRGIAAVLDLSWVYSELAPLYPKMGRPSIDPVLMIRMLVIGYAFAIRSERALCREVRVNLAYRWFCGLSIEDKIPDHSAFSRARHEQFRESDMFRRVFERVLEACIAAGLVSGEGFAVDASLIVADANKQRSIPGTEWKKMHAGETASRSWPRRAGRRPRWSPSFRRRAPALLCRGITGRPRPRARRLTSSSTEPSTPPSTPRRDQWPGRWNTMSTKQPTVR